MATKKKSVKLSLEEHHPFAQGLLDDYQDHLSAGFANQSLALKKISRYAKRARLLGVQGPLGSGKTTLLNHFFSSQLPNAIPVIFLQMTSQAFPRPFSQIAATILRICSHRKRDGKIQIDSSCKLDFDRERERLEGELRNDFGLKVEIAPEFEIPNVFKFKVGSLTAERTVGNTKAQYDDSASVAILKDLLKHSRTRFYVVLDDFHYLRRHRVHEDYYVDFVTFAETVARELRHRNVTFVLTLDDLIAAKRKEAEHIGGGRARQYTDETLEVAPFSPDGIAEMIARRLSLFDYSNHSRPAFLPEAISAVCLASKGNARTILDLLRHALDHAEAENTTRVSLSHVTASVAEVYDTSLDEVDLKILTFLSTRGPSSPVDSRFQRFVGKSRQTLQRRLPALQALGVVSSSVARVGKSPRTDYQIPVINTLPR